MPTYEYACKQCEAHLEVVQSFTDDPLTECPSCHGQLRKVFGSIGISFKGSGFYKNDSRPSDSKKSSNTDTKTTATSDTSSTSTASTEKSTPPPSTSSDTKAAS